MFTQWSGRIYSFLQAAFKVFLFQRFDSRASRQESAMPAISAPIIQSQNIDQPIKLHMMISSYFAHSYLDSPKKGLIDAN